MIRRFSPLLLTLLCVVLDTAVLPIVYGGIYTVPLTAVAVLLIGMLMGRMSGLLYGTVGGLLIDITAGTLGMMTFFFMALGFVMGLIVYAPHEHLRPSRRNQRRRRIQRAVWAFVLYALGELALFTIQYFNTAAFSWVYLRNIGVRCLVFTLLSLLLRPLFSLILLGGRRTSPSRAREVKSF